MDSSLRTNFSALEPGLASEEEQDAFLCRDEAVDMAESALDESSVQERERPLRVVAGSFLLLVSETGQSQGPRVRACYRSLKEHAEANLQNAEIVVFGPSGRETPDYASHAWESIEIQTFERLGSWYRTRQSTIYEEEVQPCRKLHRDTPPCLVVLHDLSDRQLFCQPLVKDFVGNLREVKCALVVTSSFQLEIPWEQRSKVTALVCTGIENNKVLSHLWTQFGNVTCTESEFARLVSRRHVSTYVEVKDERNRLRRESNLYDLKLREAEQGPSFMGFRTEAVLSRPLAPKVLFRFDKGKPKDVRLIWINSCLQWHFEACDLHRRSGANIEFGDEEKSAWAVADESEKNLLFRAEDGVEGKTEDSLRRKSQYAVRHILDAVLKSSATSDEYDAFDRSSMGYWIESQKSYEYPCWTSLL